MTVLAFDQARKGAWSLFDTKSRQLLKYGEFDFSKNEYDALLVGVVDILASLFKTYKPDRVILEDINMRKNVHTFKMLSWLQGAMIQWLCRNKIEYGLVQPTSWQSFCNARTRTAKEIRAKEKSAEEKETKLLSIEFVRQEFGIETENDNLADAICIGYWAALNIAGETGE